GQLAAFFRRRNPAIRVFLPEGDPDRTYCAQELAKKLAEVAVRRQGRRLGLLIGQINDAPAREHFLGRFLKDAGFIDTSLGFQMRRVSPFVSNLAVPDDPAEAGDENISETA